MSDISVDDLVVQLQQRVVERRAAGDYPPGLEQQLEAHFTQMLRQLHEKHSATDELRSRIDHVGGVIGSLNVEVGRESTVPGVGAVHGVAGAMIRRHTQHVVGQVGALGSAMQAALVEVRAVLEQQRHSDDREVTMLLAAVMDRLAVVDHLAELVVDFEERLRRLELKGQR